MPCHGTKHRLYEVRHNHTTTLPVCLTSCNIQILLQLKYKRRVYKMLKLDEKTLKALHSRANLRRFLEHVAHAQVDKITKACAKGLDPNFHCQETGGMYQPNTRKWVYHLIVFNEVLYCVGHVRGFIYRFAVICIFKSGHIAGSSACFDCAAKIYRSVYLRAVFV